MSDEPPHAPPGADAGTDALIAEIYRGLLQREPDEEGLASHRRFLAQGGAVSDLLRGFVASPEFTARQPAAPDSIARLESQQSLQLELGQTPAQLSRLWDHVGTVWATLGTQDPYWSVLTDPRFRLPHMNDAQVLDRFYQTGQAVVDRLTHWLRRNRLSLRADMVVAEYGCGVGRVTGSLARRCHTLRAFDISPPHLARAEQRMRGQGLGNIEYRLVRTPGDLNLLAGTDLFFSSIVLQHNPPPIMALILSNAFRHLKPGGIAFFQLPTHSPQYRFVLEEYLAALPEQTGMEMHCLPQTHVFRLAARHGLVAREVQPDDAIGNWGTSHSFLFVKEIQGAGG